MIYNWYYVAFYYTWYKCTGCTRLRSQKCTIPTKIVQIVQCSRLKWPGHHRLCGHYTARFAKIKQLCRACECPTDKTGYSQTKYSHRKPFVIDRLVNGGKLKQLQLTSQNYLLSGFAGVHFGLHNNRGIFGACPGEMLHLISLGWFKYCLEAFSDQAGKPGTVPVKKYDSLCATIGQRLARQSDRDVPRTNFRKGFSSGAYLIGH